MTKQKLVRNLLERGRYTSIQLNEKIHSSDARKIISDLRADHRNGIAGGADVQDEWQKRNGKRYKVYWISQHLTTKGGHYEE